MEKTKQVPVPDVPRYLVTGGEAKLCPHGTYVSYDNYKKLFDDFVAYMVDDADGIINLMEKLYGKSATGKLATPSRVSGD